MPADNMVKHRNGKSVRRQSEPTCDICLQPLARECVNLVFGLTSVMEIASAPMPESDSVVVLYHTRCYPKGLSEWLNKGYGHRFTLEEIEEAP